MHPLYKDAVKSNQESIAVKLKMQKIHRFFKSPLLCFTERTVNRARWRFRILLIYIFSFYASLQFQVTSKLGDVALGRSAEKLFVLAAKVRRVFIAHTEPGARRVKVFAEHQTARFL